jgi:hypothetical protein
MVQAAGVWAEGSNQGFRFVLAAGEGFRAQNTSGKNPDLTKAQASNGGRFGGRNIQ